MFEAEYWQDDRVKFSTQQGSSIMAPINLLPTHPFQDWVKGMWLQFLERWILPLRQTGGRAADVLVLVTIFHQAVLVKSPSVYWPYPLKQPKSSNILMQ